MYISLPPRLNIDIINSTHVEESMANLQLKNFKILVAGATGQVALPVVRHYAKHNELWTLSRMSQPEHQQLLETAGAKPLKVDIGKDGLENVPKDFDYVLNFAVTKTGDFAYDLACNAEGAGKLMLHCKELKGFLHCSSTAVYQYEGPQERHEDSPLGDNHRHVMPTYSIAKIAAEAVVKFVARQFNIPTTIARLSVPYGNNGGWPWFHLLMMKEGAAIDIHPEGPNYYNPLHEDDCVNMIPALLEAASSEPTVVNWGGSEKVSVEEWCQWLGELTGLQPQFNKTPKAFGALPIDTTKMHQITGRTSVEWRQGIKEMVEIMEPSMLV